MIKHSHLKNLGIPKDQLEVSAKAQRELEEILSMFSSQGINYEDAYLNIVSVLEYLIRNKVDPTKTYSGNFGKYILYNMDAVDFLKSVADSSVDLIITDIAYESLEKHRAIGTTTRLKKSESSSNEWFEIFPNERIPELLSQIYRVLKPNSHFYFFCDNETRDTVLPMAKEVGFKEKNTIIWDKVHFGMGWNYRKVYENILFFEKGKRKLNSNAISDIIHYPRYINSEYPTQKPSFVPSVLIQQSSDPGDLVIDPFMGSGSVGLAAISLGRDFSGNDLSPKSVQIVEDVLRFLQ